MNLADRQHQTINAELDCHAVVAHFGGIAQLCRILREHGISLSVKAVEKWKSRGSIPASQLVILAAIAKERGMRFDIYDFIEEGAEDEPDA